MIPSWVWRVAPYAIGVAVIVIAAMGALHNAREQGRAELKPEVERLAAALKAERADRARAEAAASAYRSEMDAIRSRPVPRTPVRLCVNSDAMSTTFTPADRATRTTSTSGGVGDTAGSDLEAGPDIGPELYGLARDCDAEIAKLRALQGWIRAERQ